MHSKIYCRSNILLPAAKLIPYKMANLPWAGISRKRNLLAIPLIWFRRAQSQSQIRVQAWMIGMTPRPIWSIEISLLERQSMSGLSKPFEENQSHGEQVPIF